MYKTLVWTYEWPAAAERQEREEKEKETAASPNTLMQVARFVAALGAENAFADTAAEAAVLAAAAQHAQQQCQHKKQEKTAQAGRPTRSPRL